MGWDERIHKGRLPDSPPSVDVAQLVERLLAKQKVVSSNLIIHLGLVAQSGQSSRLLTGESKVRILPSP